MFLDEAIIEVRGGRGGRGCTSFRREKYIPQGGPDGGNGGRGGSVIFVADDNADTLSDFASCKKFEGQRGDHGGGKNCAGKGGEDLLLPVPPGTVVTEILEDGTERHLGDLREAGDRLVAGKGGRGGYGNAHFKSSTRQAPDFAELGEPGEQRRVKLELKLVADAGLIGYPSVGKSTLISVISSARPKIADYPFTTLIPNLGVVEISERRYVVCDIPGLIEGASEGKGLGDRFLRHIERCGVLVHVLDTGRAMREGEEPDPELLVEDYRMIRKELAAYSPLLATKREIVILNKTDLLNDETAPIEKALKKAGIPVFLAVSAGTRHNMETFMKKLLEIVLEERKHRTHMEEEEKELKADEIPVLRPHLDAQDMGAFRVDQDADGTIRVKGKRLEQMTVMTDFDKDNAVRRFMNVIDRIGLLKSIKRLRKDDGMKVYIGEIRIDTHL